MNEEQRIKLVEEELKILKNEVKTILLDIREQYLNIQNPFNLSMVPNTGIPPAGASPEQRERATEVPPDDLSCNNENISLSPAMDFGDSGLSFGKPFADLSSRAEIEQPGLPGPSSLNDIPCPGPSAGPGSFNESDSDDSSVEEEDKPVKHKGTRGKKKTNVNAEIDTVFDDEDERNELEELIGAKTALPKNGRKKGGTLLMSGTRADLVVIAGLTQWVDQAAGKLGKDRTEALVEMSTAMGRIPENIKDVLIRMIRISRYESTSIQSPTATDYLATLAQLESLMGGEQIQDNALLSILSMMKESNRG
jgi:hypothetical protein